MSDNSLDINKILIAEFEYAKETATQAMNDRHTLVNYYLIITGVVASAVVGLLKINFSNNIHSTTSVDITKIPAILLFLLYVVGILYLVQLIRLRQAWIDSAQAMNKIKDHYFHELKDKQIKNAFKWTSKSLPKPEKLFTIFFLSSLLIIILDTTAMVSAYVLIKEFNFYIILNLVIWNIFGQLLSYYYFLSKSK